MRSLHALPVAVQTGMVGKSPQGFVSGVLNFRHRKQWESMFEDGIVIENIDIGEAVNELVLPTNGKKGQGTCIVCLLLNMILSRIQSCEVARTVLRGHLQLWGEHLSLHPRSRSPGKLHERQSFGPYCADYGRRHDLSTDRRSSW